MKLLVVASINPEWADKLQTKCDELNLDVDVISTTNEQALLTFVEQEPDAVLITEYYEEDDRTGLKGGRTAYKDIKNAATDNQVVVRSGYINYGGFGGHDDFLIFPFHPEQLLQRINRLKKEE